VKTKTTILKNKKQKNRLSRRRTSFHPPPIAGTQWDNPASRICALTHSCGIFCSSHGVLARFYSPLFALNHIKMPPKLARQMAMRLPDAQALRYHCASADVIQLTEEKLICQFIIGRISHIFDVFFDQ
jgi:hypothetical protein